MRLAVTKRDGSACTVSVTATTTRVRLYKENDVASVDLRGIGVAKNLTIFETGQADAVAWTGLDELAALPALTNASLCVDATTDLSPLGRAAARRSGMRAHEVSPARNTRTEERDGRLSDVHASISAGCFFDFQPVARLRFAPRHVWPCARTGAIRRIGRGRRLEHPIARPRHRRRCDRPCGLSQAQATGRCPSFDLVLDIRNAAIDPVVEARLRQDVRANHGEARGHDVDGNVRPSARRQLPNGDRTEAREQGDKDAAQDQRQVPKVQGQLSAMPRSEKEIPAD